MNKTLKKLLFVVGIVIALVIITISMLLISSIKKAPPETPTNQTIIVSPSTSAPLAVGKNQVFEVILGQKIKPSDVGLELTERILGSALGKTVELETKNESGKIVARTVSAISENSTYTLTVSYAASQKIVREYISETVQATPVPSNNSQLRQYLPYGTKNFILDFNVKRNLYIMHFIYDPESTSSISQQFEQAKNGAQEFIKNKNISLESITIEYLYK